MHIRQADGEYELVWLKWNVYKTQEMYNLTVDTAQTFFVGEGQWLVHNSCDPSDIRKIEDHLQKFGYDDANDSMVKRLKAGEWTPWDQRFAQHELLESKLMDKGIDYDTAHKTVLKYQGISYKPGYEAYLYHPDVVDAFPDQFSFAAQRISKILRVR